MATFMSETQVSDAFNESDTGITNARESQIDDVLVGDIEEEDDSDDENDENDASKLNKQQSGVVDQSNKTSDIYQKKAEKARWSENEVINKVFLCKLLFIHSTSLYIRMLYLLKLSRNMMEKIGNK